MESISLSKRNFRILEIERKRDVVMDAQAYDELKDIKTSNKKKYIDVKSNGNKNLKVERLVYYALGVIETLLTFRFVFKILGADTKNTFISILYSITNFFITPFLDIFRTTVSEGIETKSVFEPPLIFGMIVYAVLAWGIVQLIRISNNYKNSEPIQ